MKRVLTQCSAATVLLTSIMFASPSANAAPGTTAASADATLEAQVVDAVRQGDVLTIRVRLKPVADKGSINTLYSEPPYESIYVVAKDKKYMLLKDQSGKLLTSPTLDGRYTAAEKGKPFVASWFGKFPAPPADVKSVSLTLPKFEPLDNIPVTDR